MSLSDFLHGRTPPQGDAPADSTILEGAGEGPAASATSMASDPQFDIFEWHPAYQSCQRYFLDHAQFDGGVQAVAALVNIKLPFQWTPPINGSQVTPYTPAPAPQYSQHGVRSTPPTIPAVFVSLVPFVRRLVVTGFDKEPILHGCFGDDYKQGIGPIQDVERRNYLFAAKSGGWKSVKQEYDMSSEESVPFLRPLQNVQLVEIEGAEKAWSAWLAMEDWMVGPRAPEAMEGGASGT
ncbi:MAG: hypothetical protein Q9157_005562 [Trypethelium eluteriae]